MNWAASLWGERSRMCIGGQAACDPRSNVYRSKARTEQKIDAAVALIMRIARCMADKPARSVYETRGIQFVG